MVRENLIKCRKGKTQTEVATALGITQKHLSKLELGERNPSTALLSRMMKYYKKSAAYLFPDIFLSK